MKKIIKGIFILTPLFVLVFFLSKLRIDTVECSSQYGPCNSEIEILTSQLKGKSIFSIGRNVKKLLGENYLISSYVTQYKIPATAEVKVVERKPDFALKLSDNTTIALVDKDGYVLSFQETSSLPTLKITQGVYDKGEKVRQNVLFSLEIVSRLGSDYEIKESVLDNDTLKIRVANSYEVLFPTEGDMDFLLGSFVAVFSKLNSEGIDSTIEKDIKTIDLRFENPILK